MNYIWNSSQKQKQISDKSLVGTKAFSTSPTDPFRTFVLRNASHEDPELRT